MEKGQVASGCGADVLESGRRFAGGLLKVHIHQGEVADARNASTLEETKVGALLESRSSRPA